MKHILIAESVSCLFKDVLELGIRGEAQKIQLQVVDERGVPKAESKRLFSPSNAIGLLRKLPLPLFPQAPRWLKDCLKEDCPAVNLTKKEAKC